MAYRTCGGTRCRDELSGYHAVTILKAVIRALSNDSSCSWHLELLRCHDNFVRPHGALQFGREVRTPAMQAGLATRRLTFREIFVGQPPSLIVLVSIGAITCAVPGRFSTAPGGNELLAA